MGSCVDSQIKSDVNSRTLLLIGFTIDLIKSSLDLEFLSIGKHTLILQNPETYEESETTIEVVSRFSDNSNMNMYYADGSSFKVRVYDDNGKPERANQLVIITLNNVDYFVNTNS